MILPKDRDPRFITIRRGGTLTDSDHKLLALWAATCAEHVLHFFEAVQKAVPKMTEFEKRADGEFMLEEDREAGSYRWCSLDARRLCIGFVNPPAIEDADAHNERIF